jgi:hypothetical protein
MQPDGTIKVLDMDGNEVTPVRTGRAMQYERPKGPKYQSKATVLSDTVSVGGLEELAELDHFIVVDTNSAQIENKKISAAFFVVCRLKKIDSKYKLESLDNLGHVYEFHNATGNPEMLAILRIRNDIARSHPKIKKKIAFITDSDLGNHENISNQKSPLYGSEYLGENFILFYASSDTGQELTNKLLRFCDSESTKHLKKVQATGLINCKTIVLKEDQSIQYRFISYTDLQIVNPQITGAELTPQSTAHILFE